MTEPAIEQDQRIRFLVPSGRSEVRAGNLVPWGAHQGGDGLNFVLFSRQATRVHLELYRNPEDSFPPGSLIWIRAGSGCRRDAETLNQGGVLPWLATAS